MGICLAEESADSAEMQKTLTGAQVHTYASEGRLKSKNHSRTCSNLVDEHPFTAIYASHQESGPIWLLGKGQFICIDGE
jgi:hypothetical protein